MNTLYKRAFLLARMSTRTIACQRAAANSMIQMQIRMVHARGYNDFYDNHSFIFHEINFALGGSKNTDNFVYVYKRFGK